MYKRNSIWLTLFCGFIIAASLFTGCSTISKNTGQGNHFSGNGVTFDYPGTWIKGSSSSKYSVISLINSDNRSANIDIEKKAAPSGYNLSTVYTGLLLNMVPNLVISEKTPLIAGAPAYDTIFQAGDFEVRFVCLMSKNIVYTILFTSPMEMFDLYQADFDLIINSFKIN